MVLTVKRQEPKKLFRSDGEFIKTNDNDFVLETFLQLLTIDTPPQHYRIEMLKCGIYISFEEIEVLLNYLKKHDIIKENKTDEDN